MDTGRLMIVDDVNSAESTREQRNLKEHIGNLICQFFNSILVNISVLS